MRCFHPTLARYSVHIPGRLPRAAASLALPTVPGPQTTAWLTAAHASALAVAEAHAELTMKQHGILGISSEAADFARQMERPIPVRLPPHTKYSQAHFVRNPLRVHEPE